MPDENNNTAMDLDFAVSALGALAHQHRLRVFRLLVEAGPQGQSAGQIAQHLQMAPSSLSFHLKEMNRAGLLQASHEGRQILYAVQFGTMQALIAYLTDNCCGGQPCLPAIPEVRENTTACCAPESTSAGQTAASAQQGT